jgi:CRISPR-associated protein Csb2
MRVVLKQMFPLGRFHATPWRVNPFDDPYGEWPPSPWRLVRAVAARWYQWARESPTERPVGELDALVKALCTSRYAFHLPITAHRGNPVRQYCPGEFGWNPKSPKQAGMKSYEKRLAQDNYWCTVSSDDGALWWFLEGDHWNDALLEILDCCLERITYFGRAESFTRIRRVTGDAPEPNCVLRDAPTAEAVSVLVPECSAGREDIERVTDDPNNVKRSVPLGARKLYAARPPSVRMRKEPLRTSRPRERDLIQLAIGWNVAPEIHVVVRLTSRFRDAVLRELLRIKTNGACLVWSRAPRAVREQVALLIGKDADGRPLQGHQHAEFLVWCEDRVPTRLLVWREASPFDGEEERAILAAAAWELSWSAAGSDADAWRVRLLPLDRSVPPPPGFDGKPVQVWESITPYVAPRHHLRRGKLRNREAIPAQVGRELALRGFPGAAEVEVEEIANPTWVAVHIPPNKRSREAFLGERRGYWLRLQFPQAVSGPLRLGHSSAFGLGLFRPVRDP